MPPRIEQLEFHGATGAPLAAVLERPSAAPPHGYALLAHCFTCGKDLKAAAWIARGLAEQGFGVLRFDFTGIGQSGGEFGATNFSTNVAELVAAAALLRARFEAPRLLIGHSLGGAAALVAAPRIPEVRAVATVAAPSELEHLRRRLLLLAPQLAAGKEALLTLGPGQFQVRRQLLEDLAAHDLEAAVRALQRPLLVFHSPQDETVGIEHARRLFELARHPKSFVSLGEADHLLSDRRHARYAAEVLGAWARFWVAPPA